jgi:hypothetical protein
VAATSGNTLSAFCEWLEATPVSQFIQKTLWIIPVVQIVHILAIAAIIGSVLVINTRLLRGRAFAKDSVQWANRLLPVIWWAIPVLLATGSVMIIAEPGRSLTNPVFQIKVGLICLALLHTLFVTSKIHRAEIGSMAMPRSALTVWPSFALWIGIVFAGRWIAYS